MHVFSNSIVYLKDSLIPFVIYFYNLRSCSEIAGWEAANKLCGKHLQTLSTVTSAVCKRLTQFWLFFCQMWSACNTGFASRRTKCVRDASQNSPSIHENFMTDGVFLNSVGNLKDGRVDVHNESVPGRKSVTKEELFQRVQTIEEPLSV